MRLNRMILLTALLSIVLLATPVLAETNAHLTVTLQSYTPVPAEPGSYITVTFKVLNDGDRTAPSASLEFIDNYPFSVDDDSLKTEDIGLMDHQDDYLVEYRVRIDSAALEGTNYLKIRYTTDDSNDNWVEKELPLTVKSVQKTLAINKVDVFPEVVSPGDDAKVDIRLKNMANANLRDVAVQLNLAGTMVGTEYVDLPFAPIGSSIEKRIPLLRSGQSADIGFQLKTYPAAAAGIYKIPLLLSYTDENGNNFSRTDLISVIVNGPTDVLVQIDSSTLYSDGNKGDITFSITNRGFDEIKFLTITLGESDDYTIFSPSKESYLGNIDSDDYETTDFSVRLDKPGVDHVEFPVTVTFKDALNRDHAIEKNLTLPLISQADAGKGRSSTGLIIVIVLVVLIVGYVIYRRKKKTKQHR